MGQSFHFPRFLAPRIWAVKEGSKSRWRERSEPGPQWESQSDFFPFCILIRYMSMVLKICDMPFFHKSLQSFSVISFICFHIICKELEGSASTL